MDWVKDCPILGHVDELLPMFKANLSFFFPVRTILLNAPVTLDHSPTILS